jgi:MoaA/NifB/PqqE/SkfB family radical SAM enzyme
VIRLVVELTNRCNLRCAHCFDDRHAGTGDLPRRVLRRLLEEARSCGVTHLSFTGGEPTLHLRFRKIVHETVDAGCTFSFVSNGSTFPRLYSWLVEHRQAFLGVTFSLDGASESTHDRLRGPCSFRRVMRAASICVARRLPFTLNMVLTRQNRREIGAMIELAASLGSGGVRFGHLMPNSPGAEELELSLAERRAAEQEIWDRRSRAAVPIGMAPGYHAESPFFPCGPLELEEFNVDYRGNVTLCCHLSGYGEHLRGLDRAGNLAHATLRQCLERLRSMVHEYQATKRRRFERGELEPRDYSPCLYCVRHFEGAAPLQVIRLTGVASTHEREVSACSRAR